MTKYQIIEELKNIMNLKPQTNKEDFKFVKDLQKLNKKELITEYESRYINKFGFEP